jgi:photosystem II stability/assembly factor-like uncharacterized protein
MKNQNSVFQQNHCGVYRSEDAGEHWEDISPDKSLRHGFPISLVEDGGNAVYVVPAFQGSCKKHNSCITGKLAVYRSKDDGTTWEKLDEDLPKRTHTCVLRDAMVTDNLTPSGVYFGTTTGELYGSVNEGDSWSLLVNGVPHSRCF